MPLKQTRVDVYDRLIGLKLLYVDPVSAAEHCAVEYPAGVCCVGRALVHARD
jgi:hypothetical protein